jgi:hypothetical protein
MATPITISSKMDNCLRAVVPGQRAAVKSAFTTLHDSLSGSIDYYAGDTLLASRLKSGWLEARLIDLANDVAAQMT